MTTEPVFMDIETVKNELKSLSDDDLFTLLDAVSEEVKRRNEILSPSISDIRKNSVEDNVKNVLVALGELGLKSQK
jgi:hypothetical protein